MKIQTSKITGAILDWATCTAQGWAPTIRTVIECDNELTTPIFLGDEEQNPSQNWAQGGPVLNQARISRTVDHSGLWLAYWTDGYTEGDEGKKWMQCDRSELVAGLRCFVASKMGLEVDIPDELVAHLPKELQTRDRSHSLRP